MSWQITLNTSPLILLLKAELDFILPALFDSIYLPSGINDEIMANPTDKATKWFLQRLEFQRCNCSANSLILNWDLGKGETEVISYALAYRTFQPVLNYTKAKA